MYHKTIEIFEEWIELKQKLKDNGYKDWQHQYGTDTEYGYYVRFMKNGTGLDGQIEIHTHNRDIELDIRNGC